MKHEAEIKVLLVNNAIHLIAEGGFERATTKELVSCGGTLPDVKMNEAYIYRLFGSKERLFEAAFSVLDAELFDGFRRSADAVGGFRTTSREKIFRFFSRTWGFLMRNEERFRCYVRYYYSIYYKESSAEHHKRLFSGMVHEMSPMFKEEADVYSIVHSVFTVFLAFATRVYNGELENNEENRYHIFNVLYCMMVTYFKDNATPDTEDPNIPNIL